MDLADVLTGPPESFSMLERAIWHVLEDDWPESIKDDCIGTLEDCEGQVWNN
jgi:hypothetical protein